MRLIHISDLHLGFRRYQRLTPTGINQREWDVAMAFNRAIDKIIELKPDIVLIAGDVFHTVRPTNTAIVHAFAQFSRLMRALPDAIVVMIAGDHDSPRATETGCILRLFTPLGIHVVHGEPQRLTFADRELSILAVPDALRDHPVLDPDPAFKYNLLVIHCELPGTAPEWAAGQERAVVEVKPEEIGPDRWSYVALGHYHVYRQVAANTYYAGSIEYTSLNAWGDLAEERTIKLPGKGMIEYDLTTEKRKFHYLPATRPLIDLPPINARGMSSADLDAAIQAGVERVSGGVDDKIVRQIVRDVPRHIARELDHKALRELKRRALHYHLDTRRPEIIRAVASGGPGRRPSLADMVRDHLQRRVMPGDIDRERLVTLGLDYLREAETLEVTATVAAAGAPE
jgi:DNA repair protein SbcD/Mre11